jgi:hypothetical protein
MKQVPRLALGLALVALHGALGRLRAGDPDRGDVPGWVMLTLMSAVLVAGLLLVAQPALEGLFQDAMARVSQN